MRAAGRSCTRRSVQRHRARRKRSSTCCATVGRRIHRPAGDRRGWIPLASPTLAGGLQSGFCSEAAACRQSVRRPVLACRRFCVFLRGDGFRMRGSVVFVWWANSLHVSEATVACRFGTRPPMAGARTSSSSPSAMLQVVAQHFVAGGRGGRQPSSMARNGHGVTVHTPPPSCLCLPGKLWIRRSRRCWRQGDVNGYVMWRRPPVCVERTRGIQQELDASYSNDSVGGANTFSLAGGQGHRTATAAGTVMAVEGSNTDEDIYQLGPFNAGNVIELSTRIPGDGTLSPKVAVVGASGQVSLLAATVTP